MSSLWAEPKNLHWVSNSKQMALHLASVVTRGLEGEFFIMVALMCRGALNLLSLRSCSLVLGYTAARLETRTAEVQWGRGWAGGEPKCVSAICRERGESSEQLRSCGLPGAGRITVTGLGEVDASAAGSLGQVNVKGVLESVQRRCWLHRSRRGTTSRGGSLEEESRSWEDAASGTGLIGRRAVGGRPP